LHKLTEVVLEDGISQADLNAQADLSYVIRYEDLAAYVIVE